MILINKKCISCGACTAYSPDTFKIENGNCVVNPKVRNLNKEIQDAIGSCPMGAIEYKDFKCGHPHLDLVFLQNSLDAINKRMGELQDGTVKLSGDEVKDKVIKIFENAIEETTFLINFMKEKGVTSM